MDTDKEVTVKASELATFMQAVQNYVNGIQGAFKSFSVMLQHEGKELVDAAGKFQAACKPVEAPAVE